jgi:hypothetical protein
VNRNPAVSIPELLKAADVELPRRPRHGGSHRVAHADCRSPLVRSVRDASLLASTLAPHSASEPHLWSLMTAANAVCRRVLIGRQSVRSKRQEFRGSVRGSV